MPIYAYECKGCQKQFDRYVHYTTSLNPECECGSPTEKIWRVTRHMAASAFPFVTTNITGQPIEVTSPRHLDELCKMHGVTNRPDAAWVEKEYLGVDWRTGKQVYKESSGLGMPGCWI